MYNRCIITTREKPERVASSVYRREINMELIFTLKTDYVVYVHMTYDADGPARISSK